MDLINIILNQYICNAVRASVENMLAQKAMIEHKLISDNIAMHANNQSKTILNHTLPFSRQENYW